MSFSAGKGIIDLTINTKGVRQGLPGVSKAFLGVGAAVTAAAATVGVAIYKLTGFVKEAIDLSFEQAKAEAKLGAVLRSTGYAAGFSADQLKAQASAFQQISTFGDESIISMQAVLATFKEVKGDNFKRATKAVLDMATVLDTDLKSAALQVGKALNDPVGQLGALSRAGIILTEDQKKLITEMVETNRIADAQKVILTELESEFGKAADAVGRTFGGQLKQLKNTLNDIKEDIAKELEPQFTKLLDVVRANIGNIKELALSITQELSAGIKDLLGGFSDVVVKGDAASVAFKTLIGWVRQFRLELKILALQDEKFRKVLERTPQGWAIQKFREKVLGFKPLRSVQDINVEQTRIEDQIQQLFQNTINGVPGGVTPQAVQSKPGLRAAENIPGFRGSSRQVFDILMNIEKNTRQSAMAPGFSVG